jgi:hypothetical protein
VLQSFLAPDICAWPPSSSDWGAPITSVGRIFRKRKNLEAGLRTALSSNVMFVRQHHRLGTALLQGVGEQFESAAASWLGDPEMFKKHAGAVLL